MTQIFQTDSFKTLRAALIGTVCALSLAACGNSANSTSAPATGSSAERSQYEFADDHAIGNPNAKATIIEYASVVCGACGNWHTTVYPDFKKKYIDSGLVRFVFREFPTAPENLAQAGFLIANCAGEDKFFENIGLQFKRQRQIFAAASKGTVKDEYIAIAKAGGLSEADFEQCLQDPEEIARYEKVVQMGIDAGVTGTPSFFVNGEKTKMFVLEDFDKALRPILGEEATKSDVKEDDAEKEPAE
jgi:protein-disulfide isomerase